MERKNAVLFSTAVCNLKCTYCYINKNSALATIDRVLEESFKDPNYYFDFIKRYFKKHELECIEVWGAETFLHMDRIFPLLHKLINYYPFLSSFFASTNFSYDDWCDRVFDLLNQFGQYPEKRFRVSLQLSLDGPEPITDSTRGKGTTRKCLANYNKLLERVDEIPQNVEVTLQFKPTLSIDTIYDLNTKEKIIEYYRFFETLIEKVYNLRHPNLYTTHPIPNIGVPAPATKEDGLYFADMCRNFREIEEENAFEHYFKYYTEITMFSTNVRPRDGVSMNYPCFNCGTGSSTIGFLPNNLISSCHNGFIDILQDYEMSIVKDEDSSIDQKLFCPTNSKFTHTEEDYKKYEAQVEHYNCDKSLCRVANLAGFIRTLALAGEIDEKYSTDEGALQGALLYQSCTCNCLRDNYMVTGSTALPPEGMIKLLLNGAIDYIMQKEGENNCNECS